VVALDPRIIWPDGIFADDRYVYCVLGQWNRLPGFNSGLKLRRRRRAQRNRILKASGLQRSRVGTRMSR
jgi:hypothetical protein